MMMVMMLVMMVAVKMVMIITMGDDAVTAVADIYDHDHGDRR